MNKKMSLIAKIALIIIVILSLISTVFIYYQPKEQTFRPATETDVFEIETDSILDGEFTFNWTTQFVITDRNGNMRIVYGPFKVQAIQSFEVDKPTCLEDFVGNMYFLGDGHNLTFDTSLCPNWDTGVER